MPQSYRPSFLIIVSFIFLLPIFFVPGGAIDPGNGKTLLIVLGVLVSAILFFLQAWKHKEVTLPKHRLLAAAALLSLVYLLSALLSTPSSLSLLGYNFEVGTFGFMLLGTGLLYLAASVFSDASRVLQSILALFGSLSLLALLSGAKVFTGVAWLSLGTGTGPMANPLGDWTDLGIAMALLAVLSALALGMLPMKRSFKVVLYVLFLLSTVLLAVIHFAAALILAFVASVFLFLYFSKVESNFHFQSKEGGEHVRPFLSRPVLLPIILGVVSLALFVNPLLPGGKHIGESVSGVFGISNAEVRPTLSSTLDISKAVLSQNALFGSGPNTFGHDWLIYKPAGINSTPFWGVEFPFGAGFIPTQISATGIIGSILWLAFFALLLSLSLKVLSGAPEVRAARFGLVSTLTVSLFLWAASFLYTPSAAVLMIAFAFTGLLLAAARSSGILLPHQTTYSAAPARYVGALALLGALALVLVLGWQEGEKTLGAFHFKRAVDLSSVAGTPLSDISDELSKAVKFAPTDTYYTAISRLDFAQAQTIANSATGTPEDNRTRFQAALGSSVEAAKSAVSVNPASYSNWITLGTIYAALVPDPLKIEGAYENAQFAFNEAFKRNPSNPELPLLLAQLEINKGNTDNARSYIRSALALKPDYADAYVLLARLEASAKNIPAAIASAEKLALLTPDDAGIHFEVGLLKFSNGDLSGAQTSFEKALSISPDYANAKYYLALVLAQQGDKEGARAKLMELEVSNPDNTELKAALDALDAKPATKK